MRYAVWLVALVPALVLLPRVGGAVPVWDGWVYAECVLSAVRGALIDGLICARHPTLAFIGLHAIAQWPAPGSYAVAIGVNVALAGISALAFSRVVRRLAPDVAEGEVVLATLLYTLHPALLANLANLTPDTQVALLLPPLLWAWLEGRTVTVGLIALALALTKESGALVVLALAAAETAVRLWLRELRTHWRRLLALVPPLAAAGIVMAYVMLTGSVWSGHRGDATLATLIDWNPFSLGTAAYLSGAFVLSFGWVVTGTLLASLPGALRAVRARATPASTYPRLLVAVLMVVLAFGLSRVDTFTHPRYMLTVSVLALLLFPVALGALTRRGAALLGVPLLVAACFAASLTRTVDPVSRALYGTWSFGQHELLSMTSITGECCGHGLDGLVYNLEYLQIPRLLGAAMADLRPGGEAAITVALEGSWKLLPRLGRHDFRLRWNPAGSFEPRVVVVPGEPGPVSPDFGTMLFVEMPSIPPGPYLARLRANRRYLETHEYQAGGYALRIHVFDKPR